MAATFVSGSHSDSSRMRVAAEATEMTQEVEDQPLIYGRRNPCFTRGFIKKSYVQ
jgi:hypothetical protein